MVRKLGAARTSLIVHNNYCLLSRCHTLVHAEILRSDCARGAQARESMLPKRYRNINSDNNKNVIINSAKIKKITTLYDPRVMRAP